MAKRGRARTQGARESSGRSERAEQTGSARRAGCSTLALAAILCLAGVVLGGLSYYRTHDTAFSPRLPTVEGRLSPVGLPIDGIACQRGESLAYHIHQALRLYDRGRRVALPAAIGIPGGEGFFSTICLYWLHTHGGDPGIIHVESPTRRQYTLGDFFRIWHVTAGTTDPRGDEFVQRLRVSRHVTVFVDGRRWTRGYANVPLRAHAVITVEIGEPVVAPQPVTDWHGE